MDVNSYLYKTLRAKSYAKKKSVFDFDRTLANLSDNLTPSTGASGKSGSAQDSSEELEAMAGEYDKKLQLIEKSQNKKFEELNENSQNEIERLSKQIQKGDEQNLELSDSLRGAIERLASGRQQQEAQEAQPEEADEEQKTEDTTSGNYQDGLEIPQYQEEQVAEEAEAKESNTETAVERVAKKAVNIDDVITVGENKYRVTNLFGQRAGKNAVSGVSSSEHSRGIDMVGYSKDGKISNLPISLTDGEIVGINVQGTGKPIQPKDGRAAGYYMDVKMADGKIIKYMHLGEDAFKNKAKLLGKTIKRGDTLYEGNYSTGSGSQTSPHIKVSISSVDSSGKQLRNYSEPENDPTPYALYGKYVEQY